jgi:hypothetical protein
MPYLEYEGPNVDRIVTSLGHSVRLSTYSQQPAEAIYTAY